MKKTMFRLAQPAATTLLALSIFSIPAQLRAYGDNVSVSGSVSIDGGSLTVKESGGFWKIKEK